MSVEPSRDQPESAHEPAVFTTLHSKGYLALLLVAALIGIPLSLIAFAFLVAVHQLEHVVWVTLPEALGFDDVPAWWPILALGLAGVLVALAVKHLPGHGGHVPAMGLAAGVDPPSVVPGTVLAAGASLVLGAVVGPEAPLIVLGSGLALLAVRRTKAAGDANATAIIAASGSAAAISTIFGNPLVAAVMFLEAVGLGRRQTMMVVLPCLVSSGVGALVFTGLGSWTGLEIGALAIPDLEAERLVLADVVWAIPLAVVVATATWGVFLVGRKTAALASSHLMITTVGAGLVAGASATVYAVVTDHSPVEVVLSGQATLPTLATDPGYWTTAALVTLLACKALAYAVCLGAFRGGPAFPAIFLGAAFGVLASTWIPSIGTVPGLAIGMAAGVTVIRLPVTSIVLVVLLLGSAASSQMPVVILAVVAAMIVDELLTSRWGRPAAGKVESERAAT
jgi:H+/Cl- antiporter ClcA